MDELGFNKIAAAILVTALGYMGLKEISHLAFHVDIPDVPAYALDIPEVSTDDETVIEIPFPSVDWVASMDATRGAKVFKKCLSCHNADNGGKNGTGPNLWSIVDAQSGGKDGFKYSSALTGGDYTWDYEALDGFLTKPGKYASGTNMNFIGLKKAEDRAAVIEYLRLQSDNPIAQPVGNTPPPLDEVLTDETLPSDDPIAAVDDAIAADDNFTESVPTEATPEDEAATDEQ